MLLLNKIVKLSILIVVVTALYSSLIIAHAQAPNLTPGQLYTIKMDQWLDKLEMAESGDDSNLIYLDINHRYSYSCLQFQQETWNTQSAKYGVKSSIMDCDAQREVAMDMIQNNYHAWTNWYTSVVHRGVGLPPS